MCGAAAVTQRGQTIFFQFSAAKNESLSTVGGGEGRGWEGGGTGTEKGGREGGGKGGEVGGKRRKGGGGGGGGEKTKLTYTAREMHFQVSVH